MKLRVPKDELSWWVTAGVVVVVGSAFLVSSPNPIEKIFMVFVCAMFVRAALVFWTKP